jgi:predicted dithiol-disulfide oxidoreductase (DUF899 family)
MDAAAPTITDLETWYRERDALLVREKAHTREGDAIAAARRRLPMTEVENATLVGAEGEVRLLDLFGENDELVVYRHMWHHGQPIEGQCEGCTISIWDVNDAVYLAQRGVSFAVLSKGAWEELAPFREFMGYRHPWYSTAGVADEGVAGYGGGEIACFLRQGDRVYLTYETTDRGVEAIMSTLKLLDLTVYGRKEHWEDSPEGWPQGPAYAFWRRDGRPTAQWTRPGAGAVEHPHEHHH